MKERKEHDIAVSSQGGLVPTHCPVCDWIAHLFGSRGVVGPSRITSQIESESAWPKRLKGSCSLLCAVWVGRLTQPAATLIRHPHFALAAWAGVDRWSGGHRIHITPGCPAAAGVVACRCWQRVCDVCRSHPVWASFTLSPG